MMHEVQTAKRFLIEKYGSAEKVPPGAHAVPIQTQHGKLYLRVLIDGMKGMSGFTMYEDEACQIRWDSNKQEVQP